MDNVADRIAGLEKLLEEQERSLKGKIKWTVIGYGILVLFVLWYTLLPLPGIQKGKWITAIGGIQEFTSPDTFAGYVRSWLTVNLPAQREAAVQQLSENSNVIAKTLVDKTLNEIIPMVEDRTTQVLDDLSDMLAEAVEDQLMPAFAEFIREDAPKLRRDFAELKEDETGKGIVLIFLTVIQQELDKYINDQLEVALGDLQKKLHRLTKTDASLTKKQDAQRRALMYWAYLADHGEVGKSPYFEIYEKLKGKLEGQLNFKDMDLPFGDAGGGEVEVVE